MPTYNFVCPVCQAEHEECCPISEYDSLKVECCSHPMQRDYSKMRLSVMNPDAAMGTGIVSPLDGKTYYSRKAYDEHAKRHDCVLVGSDFASKRQKRLDSMAAKQAASEKEKAGGNLITI